MDISSLLPEEILEIITQWGQPAYHAKQIFKWIHQKHVTSFDEMTNISIELRKKLGQLSNISVAEITQKHVSKNDKTIKFMSSFDERTFIESVLMEYNHGNSVCISTQVGCRMGCTFCASSESGLMRNLSAGEMCAQVYAAIKLNKSDNATVKNIVLMGCGEPLDNFDSVLRFIELITHPMGINIGQRHITLSTCGIIPQIYKLAEYKQNSQKLQITLAISLHAPTNKIREILMPISKKYPLEELIEACKFYVFATNRRVTFEYALAKGVNDSLTQAKALVNLLEDFPHNLCHINIIPINKTNGASGSFFPTSRKDLHMFAEFLQKNNISTTVRRSLGSDVSAACGQLRAKNPPPVALVGVEGV